MDGTLSLFDWNPPGCDHGAAPRADDPPMASGSTPTATTVAPRIVVFDCETTGTDRTKDQVIELCVQHGLEDNAPARVWRIKPTTPIHPGAQAVHGIAMEDLANCPVFADIVDEITAVFAEADVIVGYNVAFDIDMLLAEYARIGAQPVDFLAKTVVDAFRLWQQFEPRSLQHAHQRFVGKEFAAAHTAHADVAATGRVLQGMLRHFGLASPTGDADWEQVALKADPTRLQQLAERATWVGPSRHLRWENEAIVIGFGKYSNTVLHELAAGPDRSFLQWVLAKDFPAHVTEVCKAALEMPGDQFLVWAREKFTPPVATT